MKGAHFIARCCCSEWWCPVQLQRSLDWSLSSDSSPPAPDADWLSILTNYLVLYQNLSQFVAESDQFSSHPALPQGCWQHKLPQNLPLDSGSTWETRAPRLRARKVQVRSETALALSTDRSQFFLLPTQHCGATLARMKWRSCYRRLSELHLWQIAHYCLSCVVGPALSRFHCCRSICVYSSDCGPSSRAQNWRHLPNYHPSLALSRSELREIPFLDEISLGMYHYDTYHRRRIVSNSSSLSVWTGWFWM